MRSPRHVEDPWFDMQSISTQTNGKRLCHEALVVDGYFRDKAVTEFGTQRLPETGPNAGVSGRITMPFGALKVSLRSTTLSYHN